MTLVLGKQGQLVRRKGRGGKLFGLLTGALLFLGGGCQIGGARDQVCFKDHCFEVRVAADQTSHFRGLQGQTHLGEKEGMIFIFPESHPYPFWMKDTRIPLDIIWLDFTQRIVHVEKNVPPCQADPCLIMSRAKKRFMCWN